MNLLRMDLFRIHLLCLMFLFVPISHGYAQTGATASVEGEDVKKLTRALSKMAENAGFSCLFRQVVYFSEGGEQHYSGTLAIRRPGHFRWQYVVPYEQLYISDGGVVWHYEADLMQAERMESLDAVDPVAMKLLDGRVGVKDIKLLATEKLESGDIAYRIQIADGPELILTFLASGDLHWLESEDMLGNRNRMILSDVDRQTPPKSIFSFTPPEGVEVIDIAGSVDG